MITQEQYQKVHDHLLANGQQELAGHLDGMWQEVQDHRSKADTQYREENSAQPDETAQEFQDRLKENDSPTDTQHTTTDSDSTQTPEGKS